jgi:Tfp pilus assembly protein PilF
MIAVRDRWLYAGIAALALLASANSLGNGFVYDDVALIATPDRLHSWDRWWTEFARTYWPDGDGYRPLTMLAWRAQWWAFGGAAWGFHAVNIALHAGGVLTLHWFARALLPPAAAWVAAALYAVHPVHTEAIANVVGQSELLVGLAIVLATGIYVHARARGSLALEHWTTIGALYAAACLVKEHAVVLPALLIAAELTVVRDTRPLRERAVALRRPMLVLALIGTAYLWARDAVAVHGVGGFRPFAAFLAVDLSASDRVLTMLGAAPEWFRLLLWPARLVTMYSPPDVPIAQGFSIVQLPGILLLVATLAMMFALRRRAPVASFGLMWAGITLLPSSNLILPAGFIIAERTMLLPSVGAMLVLASAVPWLAGRVESRPGGRVAAALALAILLALGLARSITRNRDWSSTERLWRRDVEVAPDSYLAHFRLGVHLVSSQRLAEGEAHYRRAIELFPHDPQVAYAFAEQLRTNGRCDAALPLYAWLFAAQPQSYRGHIGRAFCHLQRGQFDAARDDALLWIRLGGRVTSAREVLERVRIARDSAEASRR